MLESKLTPEEKLLRIIESPVEAVRGMRPQRRIHDFKFSLKLFKAKYGEKLKELFNLKTANAVLVFLAVITTVYLILDFGIGLPRAGVLQQLEMVARKMDIGNMAIERLEPLSLYLQEISQRNIFALPEPSVQPAAAPGVKQSAEAKSFIEGFKLVGIIWSEVPQAIIEDAKDGRTYLLNRGGNLKDARVKEILKDRVILSYDNQDIELM